MTQTSSANAASSASSPSGAAAITTLTDSRLVRCLGDLGVAEVQLSHRNFAEKLGQLIDLPDSIKLSAAHSKLDELPYQAGDLSAEAVSEHFLRVRSAMLEAVIKSFQPQEDAAVRLPPPDAQSALDATAGGEAYQRFYVAHQREMFFKVQRLHTHVREAASGLSPALAQLAALDAALGNALAARTRKFYLVIPKLLAKRFALFSQEYTLAGAKEPGDFALWQPILRRFCNEMQALLLAEIEARLLPTLGLVEAILTADKPAATTIHTTKKDPHKKPL